VGGLVVEIRVLWYLVFIVLFCSVGFSLGVPPKFSPLVIENEVEEFIKSSFDSPTLNRFSPYFGPPGQWVYVFGSNFVAGNTTITVGGVLIKAHVYDATQLGFTYPQNTVSSVKIIVKTPSGSAVSSQYYSVAVPANPPVINWLSAKEGSPSCWLYIHGDNFAVGATQVFMDNVLISNPAVYSPDQIGMSVPEIFSCSEGQSVLISVKTPLGNAVSPYGFTITNGSNSHFC